MISAKVIIDGRQYRIATKKAKPSLSSILEVINEIFGVEVTYVRFVEGTRNALPTAFHKLLARDLAGVVDVKIYNLKKKCGRSASLRVEEGVDCDISVNIVKETGHDVTIVIGGDADYLCAFKEKAPGTIFACGPKRMTSSRMEQYLKPKPGCANEKIYFDDIVYLAKLRGPRRNSYTPRHRALTKEECKKENIDVERPRYQYEIFYWPYYYVYPREVEPLTMTENWLRR